MTSQQPYIVPKLTDSPRATDFVLDSYLLHIQHTRCNCGADHTSSQLFEVWVLPSRHSGVSPSRNLRPAEGLLRDNIQIGTSRLPPKHCLVCHSCVEQLAQRERVQYDTEESWRQTLARKYADIDQQVKEKKQHESKHATAPTLDQL